MDLLRKIGREGVDWIIWLKVGTSEHGNEPSGSIKAE
jgi:hypothetical protein